MYGNEFEGCVIEFGKVRVGLRSGMKELYLY